MGYGFCHTTAFLIGIPAMSGLNSNCCFDSWSPSLAFEMEVLNCAVTQKGVVCFTNPDIACTNPYACLINISFLQIKVDSHPISSQALLPWPVAVKIHFLLTFGGSFDANSYNWYLLLKWEVALTHFLVNVLLLYIL